MTRVKICGVTTVADALLAADAGADAIGLNFCPESPRCVSVERAAAIAAALPRRVCRVGVFVDASRAAIGAIAEQVGLDAIQFHGDEDPAACAGWRQKTIKAVRVRDATSLASANGYGVDYLLADAYVPERRGGTGARIAMEWLTGVPPGRLIVAGGLTPENVIAVIRACLPAAVDVASGVERAPGIKDAEKMGRFIANAHAA
jgi:phosphoribosylanthranilate isomerase